MGCVYFHAKSDEAILRGSERAYCGCTVNRVAQALLSIRKFGDDPIVQLIPEWNYTCRSDGFTKFSTAFDFTANGDLEFSLPDGRIDNAFTVALNTAVVAGDDVLRLMVRLHGQCELHGYVEGSNRAWLADLIERGIGQHLLRPKQGWDDVIALLRAADDQPIVTSYSVCDGFPNKNHSCKHCGEPIQTHIKNERIGGGDPRLLCGQQTSEAVRNFESLNRYTEWDEDDGWYELSASEKWIRSMNVLRAEPRQGLEWRPDNWADVRFGEGITAMEIRAIADTLAVSAKK